MRSTSIGEHMRAAPATVAHDVTLLEARRRMQALRCRHLPVLREGRVVGMLSLHGLDQVAALAQNQLDRLIVSDAMIDALVVDADTPVAAVAERMIDRQRDAAVVTSGGVAVGIFTTVDALRLLRRLLGPEVPAVSDEMPRSA